MPPRFSRITRRSLAAIAAAILAGEAGAQPPSPPAGQPVCQRRGRLHRIWHHTAHTLQDDFIGYPDTFIEPPLGAYVNRQFSVQVAKADPHRFTVYRSDFLPGTELFSPVGASRFNLMYARLAGWPGPIVVEWTPDHPELAQQRRKAILATLAAAGHPIAEDRVVIGPSPYPGAMGTEATNDFNNLMLRMQAASGAFPPTPSFSAQMGLR